MPTHPWDTFVLGPYTFPPRDDIGGLCRVRCPSSVHVDKKAADSKDKGTTVIKGCPPFEVEVDYEYLTRFHDQHVEPVLAAIDPSTCRIPFGAYHPDLVRRKLRRVIVEKISPVVHDPGGAGLSRVTLTLIEWVPPPPKGGSASKKKPLEPSASKLANAAVKPLMALEVVQVGGALGRGITQQVAPGLQNWANATFFAGSPNAIVPPAGAANPFSGTGGAGP